MNSSFEKDEQPEAQIKGDMEEQLREGMTTWNGELEDDPNGRSIDNGEEIDVEASSSFIYSGSYIIIILSSPLYQCADSIRIVVEVYNRYCRCGRSLYK
jgi:hypothetical protein